MSATVDETPARHRWTLGDHRVSRLAVDRDGFHLQSWSLAEAMDVRVAAAFAYRQADGSDREVDPHAPEQVAPLLPLLGRLVLALEVTAEGAVALAFGDGSTLECVPHARAVAWQVVGAGALEGLAYAGRAGTAPWAAGG